MEKHTIISHESSTTCYANRIIELSSPIAKETAIINNFLVSKGAPPPSLDADALQSVPIPDEATDIKAARLAVTEACSELEALLTGPRELLRFKVGSAPR